MTVIQLLSNREVKGLCRTGRARQIREDAGVTASALARQLGEVFEMRAGISGGTVVSYHPDHARSLFVAKPELVPSLTAESPLATRPRSQASRHTRSSRAQVPGRSSAPTARRAGGATSSATPQEDQDCTTGYGRTGRSSSPGSAATTSSTRHEPRGSAAARNGVLPCGRQRRLEASRRREDDRAQDDARQAACLKGGLLAVSSACCQRAGDADPRLRAKAAGPAGRGGPVHHRARRQVPGLALHRQQDRTRPQRAPPLPDPDPLRRAQPHTRRAHR